MTATVLNEVAWDLDHLVDGEGDAGADRLLDEARERATDVRRPLCGPASPSWTGRGSSQAMRELEEIAELRRPGRQLRAPAVRGRHRRPGHTARSCARARSTAPRSRPRSCSSSSSGRRWTTTRVEELLAADGLDTCRHHLRIGPALPPAPAHRARGADPHREGGHRAQRLVPAVRRADLGDRGRAPGRPTSRSRWTWRCARLASPDREVRRSVAEAVTEALAPGLRTRAYIFNTLLHDKAVDDRLRRYPTLALEPQPRQRGLRRVGAGAGRGGAAPLRHPAALVPAQGAAARRRPARRLRPHGIGRRRGAAVSSWDEARRLVLDSYARSRPSWPTSPRGSSTSAGSTRRCDRASAAARSAPTRCPSVHPYLLLN